MDQTVLKPRERLTTPRAAAVAGILFSVSLMTSIALIRISLPEAALNTGDRISESGHIGALGLNQVPFVF